MGHRILRGARPYFGDIMFPLSSLPHSLISFSGSQFRIKPIPRDLVPELGLITPF